METSNSILASSIIHDSSIKSSGQEEGAKYDFGSTPTGTDSNKRFNHEWE